MHTFIFLVLIKNINGGGSWNITVSYTHLTTTSDKLTLWNDLSPGTLVVFSFYMLGVGHATIARELGITDRASEDRIKPVKRKIKEFFEHFDLFLSLIHI